jgi:hypothetical protein
MLESGSKKILLFKLCTYGKGLPGNVSKTLAYY